MRAWPLALAISLAGCTPDFDEPTTVKDLTVLAVVAEPPEIVVDADPRDPAALQALPETFPPVTLTPFLVDPRGDGRPIHYRAVVCGNEGATRERRRNMGPANVRDSIARGGCPADSPVIAEGDVEPAAPDIVARPSFTFTPTRALVLAALADDPLGALFGLPIGIELTVTAGDERIVARKRVIFTPRLTPEQAPNRNPTLPGLSFRVDREDPPRPFPLGPGAQDPPPEVPLGAKLYVTPAAEEPRESYPARVLERDPQQLVVKTIDRETLRFAFFATAGTFSPGGSSTEPLPVRDPPTDPLTVRYRAPAKLQPGDPATVEVFVVVRDERGGAAVGRTTLRLLPAP